MKKKSVNPSVFGEAKKILFALALALLVLAVFEFSGVKPRASADTDISLFGYAWSDTIGWISFSCDQSMVAGGSNTCATSQYGVSVDAAGNFSGYAWSDTIGWISFNPADVAGCPGGNCNPVMNMITGAVSGWAKILSGDGSWDGFIKLSDSLWTPSVSFASDTGGGYSWGSDVAGWISWSCENNGTCSTISYGVFADAPTLLNQPPSVSILVPANGVSVQRDNPVTFEGEASDFEDGSIPEASYKWYSGNDCNAAFEYGEGSGHKSFTRTYTSNGTYSMSLKVKDSQDSFSSCVSVTFYVVNPAVVDGVCGPAQQSTAKKPTSGFCSSGTLHDPGGGVDPISGGDSGPWSWQCDGQNGGIQATCTASNSCGAPGADSACQPNKGETPITCPSDCRLQFREF